MELTRLQGRGGGGTEEATSHMLEALFFSTAVYQRTREEVLLELQRQFGPVLPLVAHGFDGESGGGKQAVFVARSRRSGRVVVACRGTAGLRDVMQDLKYLQSRLPFLKGAKAAAHWGFAERAQSVPIDFFSQLLDAGEEVIFTGHSLGGAVASLLALRVLERAGRGVFDEQVHCITFGCPLFASGPLADWINGNYKDVFTHIISRRDVVPKILPFVSTLQRLVYANEYHLEGLLVLRKALELLPGVPLASFLARVESGIPSLFKFFLRKVIQLAWPSGGIVGSYGFAGHIVMLDADANFDRALVLASGHDMNVWYSQLGFAFGQGFNVAMIGEHMLRSYHTGIFRALGLPKTTQINSGALGPPIPDVSNAAPGSSAEIVDGYALTLDGTDVMKQEQSLFIRFNSPESVGGNHPDANCEVQIRCDLTSGEASVEQSATHRRKSMDMHQHRSKYSKWESCPAGQHRQSRSGIEGFEPALTRTRSESESRHAFLSRKLERSLSSAGDWACGSERNAGDIIFKSKEITARCRACSHLRMHMNITACCHKVSRKPVGFGRVVGTIGRVALHFRLLDNFGYLTFIRIVVANFVG